MKKLALAFGFVVLCSVVPMCDAACTFAVSKADQGCVENFSCDGSNGLNGCSSTSFSVPCTQTYYLNASSVCTGGLPCRNCLACVNIYNGNTFVANNHNTSCGSPNGCNASPMGVTLSAGITYTLYVCLTPCAVGGVTCSECNENCKALGCVYSAGQTCPSP